MARENQAAGRLAARLIVTHDTGLLTAHSARVLCMADRLTIAPLLLSAILVGIAIEYGERMIVG